MTTTDTDALTECIARAMSKADGYDPDDPCDVWTVDACRDGAAAVLPIVAEEVRKASERAWDEGYFIGYGEGIGELAERDVPNNPYEATEHETGDSDEHR